MIDWIDCERAYQAYHAADWETAAVLLDNVGTDNTHASLTSFLVRGQHTSGARPNSRTRSTRLARSIAKRPMPESTTRSTPRSRSRRCASPRRAITPGPCEACERFLDRWRHVDGFAIRAIELCEIASVLATAGHHQEIRDAALLLPRASRWRDPLLAVADKRYADAATLYEQVGSQPLAADAHLLAASQATDEGRTADAHRHAEAVLAFAERTGASLYERRAEAFVKASA